MTDRFEEEMCASASHGVVMEFHETTKVMSKGFLPLIPLKYLYFKVLFSKHLDD